MVINSGRFSRLKHLFRNLLFKNFAYLLLTHVVSQIVMFAAFTFLARKISVENFGKFGFAQAFYAYFLLLLDLGLPIYGIKKFPVLASQAQKQELVNQLISIRMLILLALSVPYLIINILLSPNQITENLIFLMGSGLIFMVFNLEWYFRAIQRMEYIALGNVARSLCFLGGILFFIRNDSDIFFTGGIYALSFLTSVALFFIMSKAYRYFRWNFSLVQLWPIIKESAILGLSFILIQVYYNFGIIILGISRPEAEVGYFVTVHKLLIFFLAIVSLYLHAVFPHLASLVPQKVKFHRFIVKLTRWSFFASFLVSIIIVFLAEPIIVMLFGEKYAIASGPFQILIFTFWVISSRTLIENSLILTDNSGKYLTAVVIGATSNLILNSIFTPLYGIYASAAVTLVSEIIFTIVAVYLSEIKIKALIFG